MQELSEKLLIQYIIVHDQDGQNINIFKSFFQLTNASLLAGLLSCLDDLIPFYYLSEHHLGHSPLYNKQHFH